MKTLHSAIQQRSGDHGGTQIGWSSLSAFHACEKRWALSELLPHPKGGFGIGGGASRPLFVGSRVHEAFKAWYLSDPRSLADWDGSPEGLLREYSAEAGFAAMKLGSDAERDRVGNDELWADWTAEARQLWKRYSEECGPTGPDPDTNYFVIAHDAEGPLVERFFEIPLGFQDYWITSRLDTIGWAVDNLPTITNQGTIVTAEHKTCDTSRQRGALLDYGLSGQLTAEALAVRHCLDWKGAIVPVINLIKKRATGEKIPLSERGLKGTLCRMWEPQDRSERDYTKFRIDMVRRLKHMTALVEEYKEHVRLGVEPLDAIELVFDGHPERETCAGQGFQCFAYDLCRNRHSAKAMLLSSEPRFPAGEQKTLAQAALKGVIE